MMIARRGGLLIALAVAAATLAGAPARADNGKSILWVQPMRNHPVHKIMQAGFLQRCKQIKLTCEVVGNPSATVYDVEATLPLAEAALARTSFDAVAVYGADPSIFPFIGKLARQGFPVVTWHVMPPPGTVKGLKAATGEDVSQVGIVVADAMGKKLDGKGTVSVTQGSYNLIENTMSEAFRKEMAARYPAIKVLQTQLEGFEPSAAKAKAVSILQANANVTAAFSTTGNGSETWSGGAHAAGRSIVIIAMDYVRQNLDLVKSGAVYGIVAQPLYEEGAETADLAAALAAGKTVRYLNPLPAKVVTAGDLDPYYKLLQSAGQ
jgi:ribose transport system substrate-binding protein